MKLDEIMSEWAKDSKIDWTEPGMAAIEIPNLHNKYLKIYTPDRVKYRKLQSDMKKLSLLKTQYYSGDLNNPEDLTDLGWEPWVKKTGDKFKMEKHLSGDEDIIQLNQRILYIEEKLKYLETIMTQINNMSFNIGNFIKWQQFTHGGN